MELLERDQSLEVLAARWHTVTSGRGQTVFVSGEAGIGKTSLVEHFLTQHAGSARMWWGGCEALFTPRPLGPLYDIATQSQGRLSQLLKQDLPRATVFSALLEDLQGSQTPTVLVIEDVHWADDATLDFIKFLGRRLQTLPILFLLTFREDELGPDHPLWFVLGDLPSKSVARIRLLPLSEQAVALLAQRAKRSAEGLHAITGGNPFFVHEVLASETPGVPMSVRAAVLTRVAKLSPAARMVLEVVALEPTRVEYWLLEAMLGSVSSVLEECHNKGILSVAPNTVAFRHEIARQAVESTLSPLRQQTFHAQLLRLLLKQGDDTHNVARLVHHATAAEEGVLVLHYAPLAARQAAAQGAHREAAAQYATALAYAEPLSLEERAALLEARAYECYLTGQMEEAEAARQAALQMWRHCGHADKVGHTLWWLSRLAWALGKKTAAEAYATEAVQALEPLGGNAELAMAYSNKAQLAMLANDPAEAVRWGERAITLAEEVGDVTTLVHALNNVGSVRMFGRADERGHPFLERSLRLALEQGFEEHAARAYTNLACSAIRTRDYQQAEVYLKEGIGYCTEHDLDFWVTYMRAWQARACFEQGAWDEAAEEAAQMLNHYRLSTVSKIPALSVLGWVRVRRGDPGSGPVLEEASRLALTTGEVQRIAPAAAARAEAAWLQGNREQCLAEARVGFELALQYDDPWALGELSLWMWRAGGLSHLPASTAEPFARQIAGDWQGAAALWAGIGCPYEQALALLDGDEQALRTALVLLDQLGAHPAAKLVRQKLHQQGATDIPRGPRPATRQNAAGLTNRQLEVLALLAEGLHNAEIASRLTTSQRTVDTHVAAILAKLEVHSRTQAITAAYALGLLAPPK